MELFQGGRTGLHYTGTYRYLLSIHLSNYPTPTLKKTEYKRNLVLLNASSSVMTYERYLA